jgi:hypothetical protein
MKKISSLILCIVLSANYALCTSDIKVRLIGMRIKTGENDPPRIHIIQKDQYVMFYQVESKSMKRENLNNINRSLWKYQYNLDFNFFHTCYHDVYHYGTYELRNTNFLYSYHEYTINKFLYYDSIYNIDLKRQFDWHRNGKMNYFDIESLANNWNDTFYISDYIPINQKSALTSNFKLASIFGKTFNPRYYDYEKQTSIELPVEIDSVGVHILKDSFLFIYNTEFSVLVDLYFVSKWGECTKTIVLYDEIKDSLKAKFLQLQYDMFKTKPLGATFDGELVLYSSLDLLPMLVFDHRTITFKGFTFIYHNPISLYNPFIDNYVRNDFMLNYLLPYIKENSILHTINKLNQN